MPGFRPGLRTRTLLSRLTNGNSGGTTGIMSLMNPTGRAVISLDQCFLSQLAIKRKRNAEFEDLLGALLKAVNEKKVVCPAHELETKYESIKMTDPTDARKVVKLQNVLSSGWAFHQFWDLVAYKMLSTIRPSFCFPDLKRSEIRLDCDRILELRRTRLKRMDRDRETTVAVSPYPPKQLKPGAPFEQILDKLEREREESMRIVLRTIARTGSVPNRTGLWDYSLGIGKALLEHQVTPAECDALVQMVDDGRWRKVDVLKLHSILFAKIEQGMLGCSQPRHWRLQDHADMLQLCVSFLYADVVTCDNPMKDLIRQTKPETRIPVKAVKVVAVTEARYLENHVRCL
jgi:hypothetical protein